MRRLPLALGAATLVAIAAVIGLAAYGELGWDVPWLFIYSDVIDKVVLLLSLAVTVRSVLPFRRPENATRQLHSMAMLVAGLGLLATVIAFVSPQMINSNAPISKLIKMLAPDYAQNLLPLAFGLLAATVATARAGRRPA